MQQVAVLEFERQCDFGDWTAVENKTHTEIEYIVDSYRAVGMAKEFEHLQSVLADCIEYVGDDSGELYDVMVAMYGETSEDYEDEDERIDAMLPYVRQNPELFGRVV